MRTIQRNLTRLFLTGMALVLILSPARPAFCGWLDGVKEMKIGEKTYPICPNDYLVKRGFPIREVPDDQNAAIEYVRGINLYVKPSAELDELYQYVMRNIWIDEADKLVPWLQQNAPAIAAVREGANKKDCRFPVFGKAGMSISSILLPHLQYMRNLGRLLVIRGKHLEHQKKYREALHTYLVAAKMGYHLSKGPILISGLVGIAVDSIATKHIESCILRNRLETDTLTYLLQRSNVIGRAGENFQVAMSGERMFGLSAVDDVLERPGEFYAAVDPADEPLSKLKEVLHIVPGRCLGLRAIMKSDFRRYWNAFDKWNALPDHIALRPENRLADDEIIQELPPWSLARMLLPALSHARRSFVRAKATKAVLTAEVALELYRNEKGGYPRGLAQLKGILDEIPKDPFINEPLKYKATENGYIVYSVNDNLVDDGGVEGKSKSEKDIVGRYPLPEPEPFK